MLMGKVLFKGILFAVWALFVLCPAFAAAQQVASVGKGEVSEADVRDWQAAQACYGEDAITSRRAGFMRMFEAAVLDEVLEGQAKRPVTRAEYDAEAARIDRETRAPDILACIKRHFGGATPRYERVFIRPILGQRYIREFVKGSPAVQASAYGLRDAILKDIAAKKSFKAIGAARGVAWSTWTYSVEEDTAAPQALEPWRRWSPFEAAFIEEHLKGLKPGEARAAPIEDEAQLKFVRLTGVEGKKYSFETLVVKKVTTEEYLRGAKKIPVTIYDRELKEWAAPIKGNPLIAPAEIAQ